MGTKPQPSLFPDLAGPKLPREPSTKEVRDELLALWNACSNVRQVKAWNPSRDSKLTTRLKDKWWSSNWRAALKKFPLPCTVGGVWLPDIEFFLRPNSVARIIEGKYDFSPAATGGERKGFDEFLGGAD